MSLFLVLHFICCYAKCRYAECRYAEFRGATKSPNFTAENFDKFQKILKMQALRDYTNLKNNNSLLNSLKN